MKRYIKKIIYCKPFAKLKVYARLFIMQKAYEGLGNYASVLEGGVHPKHRLMNYHQFFVDSGKVRNDLESLGFVLIDKKCNEIKI